MSDTRVLWNRHGDGHLSLGDCIHGTADEGRVQLDLACQLRLELDLLRAEVDEAGQYIEVSE